MSNQPDDVSCGDLQQRCVEQEELIKALLLYIKGLSDYNWRTAPRCIELQDSAAALGIVPGIEGKP